MQYDNYEKKIRKITKILRILYRNKIKIALAIVVLTTSTVLMMAAISGLLAMKGTIISSSDSYSDEIIYGEELDYSAKAFLAKVSYEYRADGSDEWSAEFPKDPGKYFVRAVAKAAVGNRYGEEKSFTLSPKPINVTISDPLVIYGEAPVLTAELVGSDMISSADFVYNEERSIAEADGDTVLIVDYLGNDITSRYVISTEERQIATAQRPITLSVVSSTKEYDGRPLVGEKVDISEKGIADGDKPKFTFIGSSITDVGETLNDVECRIFNSKGEDVTEYYRIKTNVGKLTVTPRKIKVRSSSMEPRIYDSTTYSVKKYTLWGTVAEGHEILTRRWASLTDAGKVENTFYCSINNEEGRDVTSNYDIEYEYGTLEILRRPLSVKTLDLPSTYYDGKSHSYQKYNVTGEYNVVYGQSLKCTSYASVTKAGDNNAVDNKLTLTVVDSYGRDISGNYDISYEYGKLALQK